MGQLRPSDLLLSGLLVAACVNRAPEGLLGAAVAEVGVLDLLKVRTVLVTYVERGSGMNGE